MTFLNWQNLDMMDLSMHYGRLKILSNIISIGAIMTSKQTTSPKIAGAHWYYF